MIAAGVMPGIRRACPRVIGLVRDSFSLASSDSPAMESYLMFGGTLTLSI